MADQRTQATIVSRADEAPLAADQGRRGPVRIRLAAALALGALVAEAVGLLERYMVATPHPVPDVHLFFSDTFYMKAWLASAALALACGQLVTAAGMFGLFHLSTHSRLYSFMHRWSGRIAITLTLPVAFNCLFDLGLNPPDTRIMIHATLGAFIYGVFVAKVLLVRQRRAPGWLLALAGSALFTIILGLWLTSAYWLFALYGVHL
jgi:hypothetical protein